MIVAAALVVLLWLLQLVLATRVVRAIPPLSSLPEPPPGPMPRLSLIVPARDEALGIEAALRSKLGSRYPDLEIIAVDDRSRDDTGAILDRLAAEDPRLRVIHLDTLPHGWLGKLHAMARGAERATGEWILLSDADVHVAPGVLERVIAHAEAERLDLVAVFPRMDPVNPLLDAAVAGLVRVLFLSARAWAGNDDRSSIALGVGAFNLVRRSALERTRALEELRMEIADDVGLAVLIKHDGGRCRMFAGRGEVHLTFLDSIGAAARSAGKGGGMFGWSPWLPVIAALLPLSVEVVLPLAALWHGGIAAILGGVALALATLTHAVLGRHFEAPLRGALLWPLSPLLNAVMVLRAGLRAWREQGVWWRHTFYPRAMIDEGRRIALPSMKVLPRQGAPAAPLAL